MPLRCHLPAEIGPRRREPVTVGVPWPRGVLDARAGLRLRDARGASCALQSRVLERWPDGSARWTLLDWFADSDPAPAYRLEPADRPEEEPRGERSSARLASDGSVVVDTGRGRFELRPGQGFPFAAVAVDGVPALDVRRSTLGAEDVAGRRYRARVEEIEVAESGPVRTQVRLGGSFQDRGGARLAEVGADLHFWAGSATVRIELTVRNPRRAGHRGGYWSLGSRGSIYLRDLSLSLRLPSGAGGGEIRCSERLDAPWLEVAAPFELYQDSSGGENWGSRVHVNRHGSVSTAFRGYRLRSGGASRTGRRATPAIAIERQRLHLALAMESFWENFPKALEASPRSITLRLFPRQSRDLHEIQGGEQKTHRFHVAFAPDRATARPLDWCRAPLLAHADPGWYAESEAIPHLTPKAADPNTDYLRLVDAAIEGDESFERKRERIDEYGWRNFGDLYADHEAVFHHGHDPLVSHYNNQYDAVHGFAVQFMRSGDPRWHRLMDRLAIHFQDIDVYHTDRDKSAYNHGHFWHTTHYVDAGTSAHRSFPRAPGVVGGGPSGGHLYTSGLLLHFLLTGHRPSRQTVIDSGRYVIDADDGRKTVFRWLDRSHTGVVSSSGDGYHGPGRNPANSVNALLDAFRTSGERVFLRKAEQLLRRCIHPGDDLRERNLPDVENRWFYTMFLQTLGKYLDRKIELGELDRMYAYGRAALLHYARWAVLHEYPYLEKPEILEFPNQTWSAQDMRKSEVLRLAARHAEGAERERFLDRARFFFDSSVGELIETPTHTLCRPLVLMVTLGYAQSSFDRRPVESCPRPDREYDFGEPETFVPQKERVKRRLVAAGVLAAALAAAGAIALVANWL